MEWKWVFQCAFTAHLWIYAVCSSFGPDPSVNVDADLSDAIRRMQPDFGAHLKRAFTNSTIRMNDATRGLSQEIVDQTFFRDGGSDVMIKNLRTSRSESPRLMAIEADMLQDILVIFVDFGALSLECEYEMVNSDMMNLLPVTSDGLLNATIESTRAQGRVGYVITGDSLQVNNFDLQYEIGQIHLEAIYTKSRDKLHSRSTRKSIEETILKGVRRDIENYFEGQLREKLDNVLQDVSLNQLFGENVDLTRKYVMRSKSRSDFANSLVDTILGVIRKTISSTGHSQIGIGNFKKSFRYPQNALSFIWGSFEATHGKARNLSTIQRTGDFSVHVQGSIVSIFGSLGLRELSCNYDRYRAKVWGIGPSGKIFMTAGSNSAKLKLISNGWITSIEDISNIIDLDFRLKLDKIRVEITGLGALNGLASKIMSWMASLMKCDIMELAEGKIKEFIGNYIGISM
ncbi:uncharacterized protein LOC129789045 isoform X1 [Lutzomyia longipalpis]|uniref:uncharacterized protein LOC129789045 isoform X1 n=1 Tax=Lutzomyia longipalpis TaxID=7200 RepID=UPI002483C4C7|nr:uncharacterized protein LOC129789045 isoform X1 [Lutzomyia longipalpis]